MRTGATQRCQSFSSPHLASAEVVEDTRIDVVARRLDLLREARADAGRHEAAGDAALLVHPLALIGEQLLQHDGIPLHPRHLGDAGHLARAVGQARGTDDEIQRRADLLPHRTSRHTEARHLHHHLQPGDRVAWRVGVDGRDRPVVAGVHGLQHGERFPAANVADDDAVGPHAQAVAHQVALRDLTASLDVGRAGLQPAHVGLLELELSRILDGDDPLLIRDERGQAVEERRLPRARAAGNEDVEPRAHHGAQHRHHIGRERAQAHHVLDRERAPAEAPDGEQRPVEGERRDDGVHARAVGQARVYHGRAFVDAPAHPRHDAVDDLQQVLVVAEDDRRRLELAEPLDVDLTRGVDQDVGDVRVAHERLDRPEAVDLVQDLLGEPFAVAHAERDRLFLDEHGDRALQLRGGLVHLDARQIGQVHAVEQLAMDAELQVLVGSVDGREPAVRGAARHRLAAGRGGRPVVETDAVSQLHFRASLLNTRCRSPFGLDGGATPVSFAARSAIANERADCLPLSGVPSFIAPLAAASSRGMTRSGSLPIARTASCGLTGPGITCENTGWMSWADTLRRSNSSIRRRAARTPGTERSVRMRMWSDCSNAASMAPFTVRAVSTTVWENWVRSSWSVSSTWSWPTASASSTCVGAGSTNTPRGWRVSVPARKMSSTAPFASAMVDRKSVV